MWCNIIRMTGFLLNLFADYNVDFEVCKKYTLETGCRQSVVHVTCIHFVVHHYQIITIHYC